MYGAREILVKRLAPEGAEKKTRSRSGRGVIEASSRSSSLCSARSASLTLNSTFGFLLHFPSLVDLHLLPQVRA